MGFFGSRRAEPQPIHEPAHDEQTDSASETKTFVRVIRSRFVSSRFAHVPPRVALTDTTSAALCPPS